MTNEILQRVAKVRGTRGTSKYRESLTLTFSMYSEHASKLDQAVELMRPSLPSANRSVAIRRAIDQMDLTRLSNELSLAPRVWVGFGPSGRPLKAFVTKELADMWAAELSGQGFSGHSVVEMELET